MEVTTVREMALEDDPCSAPPAAVPCATVEVEDDPPDTENVLIVAVAEGGDPSGPLSAGLVAAFPEKELGIVPWGVLTAFEVDGCVAVGAD